MVSGGMSCVKYLLFAFNLIFVIFGILLLYSGFTTVAKIGHYKELLQEAPNNVAIAFIIIGFAIFAIAFLGCCGAIKESSCMLTTFSSIILLILLVELIGAGLIFAFRSKLNEAAEEGIKSAIKNYSNISDSAVNKVLDDIQSHLNCCGAHNYSDWAENKYYSSDKFPYSCCDKPVNLTCYVNTSQTDKYQLHTQGCIEVLNNEIRGSFGLLGGIAIAVAVIQLIGVIFSCSLSRSIKKEYEVV